MLSGRNLVVLGFGEYAELPKLLVKLLHELRNARLQLSEVVVIKLLSLGSLCSEKCSACIDKVFSLIVEFFGNKEIFLFGTYCCLNRCYIFVSEKLKDSHCFLINIFH